MFSKPVFIAFPPGSIKLLDFDKNALLETSASEYNDQIKYIPGSAKDQSGISAALIRPDGFIAWAADRRPDLKALKQAAALWFA